MNLKEIIRMSLIYVVSKETGVGSLSKASGIKLLRELGKIDSKFNKTGKGHTKRIVEWTKM
jgi:hypothetical protein